MKNNKKIYLCILIFIGITLYPVISVAQPRLPRPPVTIPAHQFSAILVAHGSANSNHNEKIITLKNNVRSAPTPNLSMSGLEVALLGNSGLGRMGSALNNFHGRGTRQILLIPLSPCSYLRHAEIETLARNTARDLRISTFQFTLAPAMDDHPIAAEIIKEHARNKSVNPHNESLLLFAYGPVEEIENIAWLRRLEQMGEMIKTEMGFKEVVCATVRNHSPDLIAEQSVIDLRRKARDLKDKGRRIIVVPYVFEDGPYEELQSYLKGIVPPEDIVSEGFISNAKTKDWVKDVIRGGMTQPVVKEVNRHWSTQDGPKGKF